MEIDKNIRIVAESVMKREKSGTVKNSMSSEKVRTLVGQLGLLGWVEWRWEKRWGKPLLAGRMAVGGQPNGTDSKAAGSTGAGLRRSGLRLLTDSRLTSREMTAEAVQKMGSLRVYMPCQAQRFLYMLIIIN